MKNTFEYWKLQSERPGVSIQLKDCVVAWEVERKRMEQTIQELGDAAIVTESRFDGWNEERNNWKAELEDLLAHIEQLQADIAGLKHDQRATSIFLEGVNHVE